MKRTSVGAEVFFLEGVIATLTRWLLNVSERARREAKKEFGVLFRTRGTQWKF